MSWTIGQVRISKVADWEAVGNTNFILPKATKEAIQRMPWLIPVSASEDGSLRISVHSFVVETPSRRMIIDTGVGNDKRDRKLPAWNGRRGRFLETMAAAGFSPESIDTVICTHFHGDHVGWNTVLVDGEWVPTFAKARYILGEAEYGYWCEHSTTADSVAVFNDSVKPIVDAGVAEFVADDAKIASEVQLIPTPGHSPGHMSVHIRSLGEEALLIGDVAHHPCQMAHLDWCSTADSDPEQTMRTRREVFDRFADTPTLIIGGHFGAGHIQRDGNAYKFRFAEA
jgi:glyoxylase-like metal-dependent hydrolase (beta-lactamase superfamily II)